MRFRLSILAVILVCLMLTSGGVASAQDNGISSYDLNQNNRIDRAELLSVIRAHLFGGTATRGDVLQAIRYHLFDTPVQPETPVTTPSQSFEDGTWIVGSDIAPGLYVAPGTEDSCYWERLSGFGGTLDEIIANEYDDGRQLVEIASTDVAFKSDGCGLWTPIAEIMFGPPRDYILEGFWRVGEEIIPGVYSIPDGESCYWERLSGFGGTFDEIIGNDYGGSGRQIVEIQSTDIGFHSSGCGEWSIQPETPVTTPSQSFGDGTWIVGSDIAPGLYVAPGTEDSCFWERLSGFGGTLDEIIANEYDDGRQLVEIASTDVAFKSDGCGLWTPIAEIMFGPPRDYILEGFWRVGEEIIPGVYSIPDGESCYWERLSGFGGTFDEIIGSDYGGSGRQIVEIQSTDIGFHSSGCGEWSIQTEAGT